MIVEGAPLPLPVPAVYTDVGTWRRFFAVPALISSSDFPFRLCQRLARVAAVTRPCRADSDKRLDRWLTLGSGAPTRLLPTSVRLPAFSAADTF